MPDQKNKKSPKKTLLIIGIIIVGVIIVASTSYIIYSSIHKNNYFPNRPYGMGYRNFTLDNETLNQTINLFNSATDMQSITSYCQNMTMFYCRYYCNQINSSNSFCSQLPMPAYGNNPMRGGQQ